MIGIGGLKIVEWIRLHKLGDCLRRAHSSRWRAVLPQTLLQALDH